MTTNRTPTTSAASTATTSAASLLRHLLPALRALAHRVLIDAMTGMAHGLFASLILGTILGQLGRLLPGAAGTWLTLLGAIATSLTGAGIGVGVAHRLKAPTFVVVGAMVAGQVGARAAALLSGTALQSDGGAPALVLNGPGEPLGAFIAAWAAVEAGRLVAGRTSLDILVTPTLSVCAGGSAGLLVGPPISRLMISLGQLVNWGTERQPLLMGIIVSALMGIILTLPISSAALGIILDLSGLAAGAATIGCTTQMVGFAVASYRENRFAGLIAQGLGTSMLQVPNIVRHPLIWVPPTLGDLGPHHHHGAGHAVQCHRLGHGFGGARGPDHDLPDNVGLDLHRAAHRPHSRLPDPHPRAADPGDQRAHAGPRLDQTGGHGPGRRLRAAAAAPTRPRRANRLNHSQPSPSRTSATSSHPALRYPTPARVGMAGIKQNGILGQLLRDSWLAFTEGLL